MSIIKRIVNKCKLRIQKAFAQNIDKLYVESPHNNLMAKLSKKGDYQQYNIQFEYLRNFEEKLKHLGNPDFVKLKGSTYQMNLYGKYDNLRESCLEENGLSSRLRYSLEIINDLFLNSKAVYLTEHDTPYHRYLKNNFNFNISSSLFNPLHSLHQDMTQLNYPDNSFDLSMSFEDLEHIPDYKKAISELYRVTRKGGAILISAPFKIEDDKTTIRAIYDTGGEIIHLEKPEYHGDPVKEEGILSFYDFGWEFLDDLSRCGFSETKVIVGYDISKLILQRQLFIVAVK